MGIFTKSKKRDGSSPYADWPPSESTTYGLVDVIPPVNNRTPASGQKQSLEAQFLIDPTAAVLLAVGLIVLGYAVFTFVAALTFWIAALAAFGLIGLFVAVVPELIIASNGQDNLSYAERWRSFGQAMRDALARRGKTRKELKREKKVEKKMKKAAKEVANFVAEVARLDSD